MSVKNKFPFYTKKRIFSFQPFLSLLLAFDLLSLDLGVTQAKVAIIGDLKDKY